MKPISVMLGTAGHVDHGKTSLVRRLTGFDTDTLAEEKRRGMSIEFAVAPCQLSDSVLAGIIDVPGHEDFIRSMAAGASSIDILVLVIAADDAVMPQTLEHLEICKLLGVRQLVVALTKIDLVADDLRELAVEDTQSMLKQHGFDDIPVFPISNLTGEGVDALKSHLAALAQSNVVAPDARAFRMFIRKGFTMKGYGTVVTGVPVSGSVAVDASLEILPGPLPASIRGIETYRSAATETRAHISSAINLREVSPDQIERGMTLCEPNIFLTTRSLIVSCSTLGQAIENRREVRLLVGTASRLARVRTVGTDTLIGEGFLHLRLRDPLVVAAGDRFVIRSLSPAATLGGGVVLSVDPDRVSRRNQAVVNRLQKAKEAALQGDYFRSELFAGEKIVFSISEISYAMQRRVDSAALQATSSEIRMLDNDHFVFTPRLSDLRLSFMRELARYHRQQKHAWGMTPTHAASVFGLANSVDSEFAQLLVEDGRIVIKHGRLALADFSPQINPREIKLREQVLNRVVKAGAETLARGPLQEELKMTATEMKAIQKLLLDEELIVVLGSNLILRSLYSEFRDAFIELAQQGQVVDLKRFRERTATSRNVAVAILESFDSEGLSKREGEGRILVRKRF